MEFVRFPQQRGRRLPQQRYGYLRRLPDHLSRHLSRARFIFAVTVLCVAARGGVLAQDFVRGDFNGDGTLTTADTVSLATYLYNGASGPSNACGGTASLDIGDVNDNEFLTLADVLLLQSALFAGATIAAPNVCGPDPSNDFDGFDVADSSYRVAVFTPVVSPETGPGRTVEYPILITAPDDIVGVELYFAFDPTLISDPVLVGNADLAAQAVVFNVVAVRLAELSNPVDIGIGTSYIGSLIFDLADGEAAPDLQYVAELFDVVQRRTTLITPDLRDHHPIEQTDQDPYFLRGDCSGDGEYTQFDISRWLDFFYNDLPLVVSSCSPFAGDTFDVNDNEYVTTADLMKLTAFMSATVITTVAEPSSECGQDVTTDSAGFEQVDNDYAIVATDIVLIGAGPIERDVHITLKVVTPTPMIGFQLALRLNDPDLELDPVPFVPSTPLIGAEFSTPRQQGNAVLIAFGQPLSEWLPGMPGVLQDLGTLRLKLNDVALAGNISFEQALPIGFVEHHTSIIDIDYQDHRPLTVAGDTPFVRGDSNTSGNLDITDAIFVLSYLFSGGTLPNCLDAADANNDSLISIVDALAILNHLFLGAGPLPQPNSCGNDTDIDDLECASFSGCP